MQVTGNQVQKVQTLDDKPLVLKILNIVGPIAGFGFAILPFVLHFYSRQPRYLPVNASFNANNQTIKLEVANKPEDFSHGLKFRKSIEPNRGMLFVLRKPEKVKLWMKDTYIPLDMVFLQDGIIKTIVESAPPCKTKTCSKYDSVYAVNQVIELTAGSAKRLDLKPGKKVELNINSTSTQNL